MTIWTRFKTGFPFFIDGLGGEDTLEISETKETNSKPEEIVLTDNEGILDIYEGGDQRVRPSSNIPTTESTSNSETDNAIEGTETFQNGKPEEKDEL